MNRATTITALTQMINSGSPQAKEQNAFCKNKQSNNNQGEIAAVFQERTSDKQPA